MKATKFLALAALILSATLFAPILANAQSYYNPYQTYQYTPYTYNYAGSYIDYPTNYYPTQTNYNPYLYGGSIYQYPTVTAPANLTYDPYQNGAYYSYGYGITPVTTYTNVNPDVFRQIAGPYRWTSNYPTIYSSLSNNYQSRTCPQGYICTAAYNQEIANYVTTYPNQTFFYTY